MIEHVFQHMFMSGMRALARVLANRYPGREKSFSVAFLIVGPLMMLPLGIFLWTRWLEPVTTELVVGLSISAFVGAMIMLFGFALLRVAGERHQKGRI